MAREVAMSTSKDPVPAAIVVGILVATLVVCPACDPKCPSGYQEDGEFCRRIKDAGATDDAAVESDADTVSGSTDAGHAQPDSDGRDAEADAPSEATAGGRDASEGEPTPIDSGCIGSECPE